METKEKTKRTLLRWGLTAGIPAALIGLFYGLSGIRAFANFAADHFSRPLKNLLGTVFGLLPFSVMELMYVGAGVFVIWFLARTVVLVTRAKRWPLTLLRRAAVLSLVVVYFFTAYLWMFGIDYRSDSFEDKSGLVSAPVKTEELYAVTRYFVTRAASLSDTVARDEEGHFAEDLDAYFAACAHIYDNLSEEFPFLSARSRIPKKMFLFSKISSAMGFTGVYFPFSGESNINIDAPKCMMPATIAHELAHQRGIYAEQEANFVGIAACVSSGEPVYVYAGYLMGSVYLSNALYKADRELWYEVAALMSDSMRMDWTDNNAYWKSFESKVTEVSEKVYDTYLKSQGQELGFSSYGACVDLLVAYYIDAATA